MKEIVHVPQCRNGKIALLHITLSGGLITEWRARHSRSQDAMYCA